MTTTDEMAELIGLWGLIQDVILSDQEDVIKWKWTADGNYSAKSAYNVQLKGSYCSFDSKAIWSAKVEGKHRFFAWLLVQSKLLTADKLMVRNWPCNPVCSLCEQAHESAVHLALHCVYAKEVWWLVSNWSEGLIQIPADGTGIEEWWNAAVQGHSKEVKRRKAAILIYTVQDLWKERNRRIFEGVACLPPRIVELIKEEMDLRAVALRPEVVQNVYP